MKRPQSQRRSQKDLHLPQHQRQLHRNMRARLRRGAVAGRANQEIGDLNGVWHVFLATRTARVPLLAAQRRKTRIFPKNTACPCGLTDRPAASSASSTGVHGQAVARLDMPGILAAPSECRSGNQRSRSRTYRRPTWISVPFTSSTSSCPRDFVANLLASW
jgi:hypothetical protein